MGTINDLNTTDVLSDEDKFPIWKASAQATRAITALDMATYFGGGGTYQPLDAMLTSIAATGPSSVADRYFYTTAQDVVALGTITAFGRSLVALADAGALMSLIGAQPLNARLTAISGLTTDSGDIFEATGASSVRSRKLQVATYAALRLLSGLSVGDVVFVNGRTALRDGGEGWGTVAAGGTDRDGLVIVMADGKAWVRNDIQESVDADVFGIVPGTVTVADFDTMVTTMSFQNTRTVDLRGGIYVFPSRPANITTILRLDGVGESVTTLERGYSEGGGDSVGFLEWRDANASNSKLSGMLVRAGSGTTGGTMVRFIATTTSVMGWPEIENVVVSPESGAYAWALDINGILNTTVGSQGVRSVNVNRSQFFGGGGAGTNAIRLQNVVNSHLSDVWTNGNVLISGGGTSLSNTNRLTLTGFECLGTLTVENCDHVLIDGTMEDVIVNATAANVAIYGEVNDLTIASGATGCFMGRITGTLTNNAVSTFTVISEPMIPLRLVSEFTAYRGTVNLNTTADQALTLTLPSGYTGMYSSFFFIRGNAAATSAVGGIYTGAGKTGTQLVASTQTYTNLTAANKKQNLTLNSADIVSAGTVYFSLTTPHGSAATGELVLAFYPVL
jgi:hypothetical protein